ncbi:hypothetical protein FBU31_006513, partial [Coemansia sp. 'formosensis']
HGHGVPSMLSNDYFHIRNGAKIPWLEDCLDGHNMEMTLWILNGQGSQQFAILSFYLQMTTAPHRFFGDFLDYPQTLLPSLLEGQQTTGRRTNM